ncbi:PD40 domain-containing protein [Montanilutibacter psychrotolerans]|nr:PD40 domain-containing protein [Lysobacter psychrotolerans]
MGLLLLASACSPMEAEPSGASANPSALANMPAPLGVAERQLPLPQANAARLAGAGWLSGTRNDYNLSTDSAQDLMVFARSEANFKQSRIWFAQRQGIGWGEVAEAPFSDPRYRDSDPWLTPDGQTLYFVSNRPASGELPNANLDIWRAALEGGSFGVPERLDAVASDGEELGPELHDGWLYFNSSRKGGPAKLAIYRARMNGSGFDAPQPLGAPFNDGAIQGDFTLSSDGRLAVFWSQRDGSSDADLFATCRTKDAWSAAVRLPSPINAPGMDFTPSLSVDDTELRFASMRTSADADVAADVLNGQANIYVVPTSMAIEATRQGLRSTTGESGPEGCDWPGV